MVPAPSLLDCDRTQTNEARPLKQERAKPFVHAISAAGIAAIEHP
jgi:hypothetical protein